MCRQVKACMKIGIIDTVDHGLDWAYVPLDEMLNCSRYSHLSRKEREADIEPARDSKTHPKVGRDEPCPCGSGKKHKRCCIGQGCI
jgi:preprotein translocase subunit SecA